MRVAFLLLTILPFVVAQAAASEGLGFLTGTDKRGAFSDPVLSKFLPVNQAFQANAWWDDGRLYVGFRNAEGYYLHRHQFALESRDSTVSFGELELPPGELVVHEYLGEIYVFYGSVMFSAPIETTEADIGGPLAITVTFQGCSDGGLCYPPAQIDLEAFSGSPPAFRSNWTASPGGAEPRPTIYSIEPMSEAPFGRHPRRHKRLDSRYFADARLIAAVLCESRYPPLLD